MGVEREEGKGRVGGGGESWESWEGFGWVGLGFG